MTLFNHKFNLQISPEIIEREARKIITRDFTHDDWMRYLFPDGFDPGNEKEFV